MRWGRRRKERGTSGMAGWWLEARERASASRPWEHSSMAMAAAPSERERQRERVPERARGSGELGRSAFKQMEARWQTGVAQRSPAVQAVYDGRPQKSDSKL